MQPDAVELGPLRGPLERSRHHVGVDGLTITAVHDEPGVGPRLAADQASLGLLGAVPTSAAIVTGGIEISRRACGVFPSRTRTTAPSTSLHRSRRISDRRIPVVAARTSPTVQGPSAASEESRRARRSGDTELAPPFAWRGDSGRRVHLEQLPADGLSERLGGDTVCLDGRGRAGAALPHVIERGLQVVRSERRELHASAARDQLQSRQSFVSRPRRRADTTAHVLQPALQVGRECLGSRERDGSLVDFSQERRERSLSVAPRATHGTGDADPTPGVGRACRGLDPAERREPPFSVQRDMAAYPVLRLRGLASVAVATATTATAAPTVGCGRAVLTAASAATRRERVGLRDHAGDAQSADHDRGRERESAHP